MESESESLFKKVVGGTPEQRQTSEAQLEKRFKDKGVTLKPFEVPPTEREKEIIENAESGVDEILKKYGIDIDPRTKGRVRLLKPERAYVVTGNWSKNAFHSIMGQYVGVERLPSDLELSVKLAHELFHLKAYKSARINKEGETQIYRAGIAMFGIGKGGDKKKVDKFFGELGEAIVAELNRRFYQEYIRDNHFYAEEVKAVDIIKRWALKSLELRGMPIDERGRALITELITVPNAKEIAAVLESKKPEEFKFNFIDDILLGFSLEKKLITFERYYERKKFSELLDEIMEKSGGKFKDKEELFGEFARANFNGHYLKIAKIIEKNLGKGAFRRIAEEFKL